MMKPEHVRNRQFALDGSNTVGPLKLKSNTSFGRTEMISYIWRFDVTRRDSVKVL